MVPGGQIFDLDNGSCFYKLVANHSKDVRVNALVVRAGVGDFLFQCAHRGDPVLFQDVNDALFSEFPPFFNQSKTPYFAVCYLYIYSSMSSLPRECKRKLRAR